MFCFYMDYNKNNMKVVPLRHRVKFSQQEDEMLLSLISKNGPQNWNIISKSMPGRTAKQCRDRYCNYLSVPNNNRPWNEEEDQLLLTFLSLFGPKWVEISRHIPGRSGNNVKNRWYKHLNKIYSLHKNEIFIKIDKKEIPLELPTEEENSSNEEGSFETIQKQYSIASLLV